MRRFLSLLFFLSIPLAAQNVSVSGYVTDIETGEPLLGAGVVYAPGKGCVTNDYGHYAFSAPAGELHLECSYLGYETEVIVLSAVRDTVLNIALRPDPSSLEEAVVSAYTEAGIHSRYMGTLEIQQNTIRNTPVPLGEPDLLKTVQMMPGVQAGNDGFSGVYVRGGGQDETLFLMDGAPMYNVSHVLGLLSSFSPEAVKKVTLYKGPFPARFGGRVSGIVDVRTNDGDMHGTKGSVSVGMLTDRFHIEGPIVRNRLTYSVSARALHTFIVGPILKWSGLGMNYWFYDLNGKLSWRMSQNDRMYLSAYLGDDRFWCELPNSEGSESEMNWGDKVVSARWTHSFDAPLFLNMSVYWTNYRYASEWSVLTGDGENAVRKRTTSRSGSAIMDIGGTADMEWRISDSHRLRGGVSVISHRYNPRTYVHVSAVDSGEEQAFESGMSAAGWENSLYVEDDMRLGRLNVDLGLRGVQMTSGSDVFWSLEPRVTLDVDFGKGFSAKLAAGRSSQYVHLLTSSIKVLAAPSDMWVPVTRKIRPVTSDIVSLGAYWSGLEGWEFSLEGYLKHTDNVIDYKDGVATVASPDGSFDDIVSLGEARSKGLELYVRKTSGKATGWLSYTLSKTDRRHPDGSVNAGNWFPDTYDRRHNLSLSFNYRFNERMDLTATWIFMSGSMATVPENTTAALFPHYNDPLYGSSPTAMPYISSRNNYRLPPTHRLNLGFNLRKHGRHGENVWTFGIYNVYNAHNPNLVYMLPDESVRHESERKFKLYKMTFLPVLPSVSYTFNF